MQNIFKSKKIILVLAILTMVVLSVYFVLQSPNINPPQLVSSNPSINMTRVALDSQVLLNFDKPVEANNIIVTTTPEESWEIENIDEDSLLLKHRFAFHPSTKYELTFSSNDRPLGTLSFTTVASQGDVRLIQTIEEKMKVDYPLSRETPLTTSSYTVVYSAPLTLEITRKNSILSDEEIVGQVRDWVAKNGKDPNTHTYIFAASALTP